MNLSWLTLARIPYACGRSSPTNSAGTPPVVSAKSAMFDEEGADGLSVPAAYTPEEASGEKARDETMPVCPRVSVVQEISGYGG